MTNGSQGGIHLAGLFSAAALYAGILGYLQFQGTENLDKTRHGIAVNTQLQNDLEARADQVVHSADATAPADSADRENREERIVRPLSGGIFATADGGATAPAAGQVDGKPSADAGATTEVQAGAVAVASPDAATLPVAQSWPVSGQEAYTGYAAPVAYDAYAVDYGYAPAGQGYGQGSYLGDGYGQGRGRGDGRGNWNGDGEFSFSMRFVSRLRGDADIDADSDWNADSAARAWQDARQRQWWQHGQAARYASWNR